MSDHYMNLLAKQIGYTDYQAYLRSDHWKEFVKNNIQKRCVCCSSQTMLQMHHTDYKNLGKEVYNTDTITVCNSCHIIIHKMVSEKESRLRSAHHDLKRKRSPRRDKWVKWFRLQNRSAHQTLGQLKDFLMTRDLSDGYNATEKAFKLGYAKIIEGKERWNLHKFKKLCSYNKSHKRKKTREKKQKRAIALEKRGPLPYHGKQF